MPTPFDCWMLKDVGIWLETDWYRQHAVIKEIKKDSYAFKHTEVQVKGRVASGWSEFLVH